MDKLNILCNYCVHNDICKMRKEFIVFNAMATNIKATKHKDDTLRFPDFNLTVKCGKYQAIGVALERASTSFLDPDSTIL